MSLDFALHKENTYWSKHELFEIIVEIGKLFPLNIVHKNNTIRN